MFGSIWLVGGGAVSGACLRLGLAGEVRFYILPELVSDGVLYFPKFHRDVAFHLTEVRGYKSGMVELCYEVRGYGAV
jgi:dihydrofolate reductase